MIGLLLRVNSLEIANSTLRGAQKICLLTNVSGRGYNRGIKKGKLMKTICVFCFTVYEADTVSCYPCKEYKGIMPLNLDTLNYLGEDPDDWREELADTPAHLL